VNDWEKMINKIKKSLKYFIILSLILSITSISLFTKADDIKAYSANLEIYRFIEIIDVSENGSTDVWILILLRFNQSINNTYDYELNFSLPNTNRITV
jgi:hypothetical protein